MEKTLTVGRTYAVTTASTCDVTDANGTLITSAASGQQVVFVAPTTTVSFSDDSASVVAVFKLALAKTRLFEQLGGGRVSAGYLPALFLESAAKQYIETGVSPTENTSISLQAQAAGVSYIFANANANRDEEKGSRFWMTATQTSAGAGQSYVGFGTLVTNIAFTGENYTAVNLYGLKNGEVQFGSTTVTFSTVAAFSAAPTVTLFRHRRDTASSQIRIWWCKFTEAGVPTRDYVPCLDSTGKPCMFDKVTREPYYNANSTTSDFTVGMTVAQARRLGSLPADAPTKTLTLSLPKSAFVDVDSGEIADAAVNAALAVAESNGWVITKRYFEE